jgi:hypothetical protein
MRQSAARYSHGHTGATTGLGPGMFVAAHRALTGGFPRDRGHGIGLAVWSRGMDGMQMLECTLRLIWRRAERTIALYSAPGTRGRRGME